MLRLNDRIRKRIGNNSYMYGTIKHIDDMSLDELVSYTVRWDYRAKLESGITEASIELADEGKVIPACPFCSGSHYVVIGQCRVDNRVRCTSCQKVYCIDPLSGVVAPLAA